MNGLLKDKASGRKPAVQAAIQSMKAKMECLYFGANGSDIVMLVDAPDNISVASLTVTVMSTGAVDLMVTSLLTVEEMDAALTMSPKYRAPGN
ncbi:MAG: GYD domain-containing protein [Acidobacteria bacterium]|nr:GYD domain-containing protein [Acidobacteriota bacterium]